MNNEAETETPELFPEPLGYESRAGCVKNNPMNNAHYLAQWADNPWYEVLEDLNYVLERHAPGYNISQIKVKFGGLRFYVEPPKGGWPEGVTWEWVTNQTNMAEARCWGINRGRKQVAESVSAEAVAKEIHRGSSLGLTVPWEDTDETYRNAISQSEPVQAILNLFRA